MKKLDAEANPILDPLITGKPIRLSQKQQTLVATWAVMNAIVSEYETPEDATTHHMQRNYLFRKKQPPRQGWVVWIGHHPRKVWTPLYNWAPFLALTKTALAKRKDPRATHYNSSIITQVIGELFVQVSHAPKFFHIADIAFPPLKDGGVLFRIWPAAPYSLIWPPSAMSDSDRLFATNFIRDLIASAARRMYSPVNQ